MGFTNNIWTTSLASAEFKYWKQKPIDQYFPQIQSFLSLRLGKEFGELLAEPTRYINEKGINFVSWNTYSDSKNWKPLSSLENTSDDSKQFYQIQALKDFIQVLTSSSKKEDNDWGKLLELCLTDVSLKRIFYNNNKITIAEWGIDLIERGEIFPFSKSFIGFPAASEKDEAEKIHPEKEILAEEKTVETTINIDETHEATEEEPNSDNIRENDGVEEINDSNEANNRSKFNLFWIIPFLLIPLFFLLRGCDKTNSGENLPDAPGVLVPIDSSDVIIDDDSLSYIVKNRINILLRGTNKDINLFSKDFKKAYPSDDYKIIYYDTTTNRIQIRIPESDREIIVDELPKKLLKYDLLIWHENMYKRNIRPSDPDFKDKAKSWYFDAISAPDAWSNSYGNKDIIVAVIDDGFDLTHPEIKDKIVKPWNVVGRNRKLIRKGIGDHGSHVAGTAVGSRENNSGTSGIAPDCMLMPIRVADNRGLLSTTAIVDGILYAINQGAQVINISLGLMMPPSITRLPTGIQLDLIKVHFKAEEAFWESIFEIAAENNVTIVIAGGNENCLIALDPMKRSNKIITVSALDQKDRKAAFSNYGNASTISAPGVQIYNAVPNNKYEFMQGTSMASPIVAGAVALLKSIDPDLTTQEIKSILINTGKPVGNKIGPMLQLAKAIQGINDKSNRTNPVGNMSCNQIQAKIDSLLLTVELLRGFCPDMPNDTMKIPSKIEDLDFTIGSWKSTTSITNDEGEPVTIHFDFLKAGKGKIILTEVNGLACKADLNLRSAGRGLEIMQDRPAKCIGENKSYSDYTFKCSADPFGKASCIAQNKNVKANIFKFNLIKIK